MRRRRPLLVLLLILLAVSVLASPGTRTGTEPAAPPGAPGATGASGASGASGPPAVTATLPADRSVRVAEGRVLALRVTSLEPDIARIDALGLSGPVGPALEGPTFYFVASPAGTYAVRLDVAGTKAGTVEIVKAAR